MSAAAASLSLETVIQAVGTVTAIQGGRLSVAAHDGVYQAERAVSCLVEPTVHDFVLMAVLPTGPAYVLAVLTRESAGATLSVKGDLRLRPENGRVVLASSEGVSIASSQDVSIAAGKVDVNAVDGVIGFSTLRYVGRFLQAEVEKTKLFGSTLDRVFDRVSETVKRAYRVVEELDQLRAERVDHSASETMRLHGRHTLMTARELVKVDGEQIHMG